MNTNEPCAAVFPVDEDFMRLPNNDVIPVSYTHLTLPTICSV